MSGTGNIASDQSLISRAERKLYQLEMFFALLSGLTVFILMLMAVGSVVGRNFFATPLPGYVDWIEQAMPLIAFMGMAYCQRLGAHIRMDMVLRLLPARFLFAAEFMASLLILILALLLMWGSFEHFLRSFDFASPYWSRDSSLDLRLPLWPAKLLAPIAFFILCLRLNLHVICYLRLMLNPKTIPIGVPILEDIETIAKKEAAGVEAS